VTTQQALSEVISHYRKGETGQAQAVCEKILTENPKQPDALNLLGLMVAGEGRLEEGAKLIQQAIAVSPNFAPFHANLGETLRRQGTFELAVNSLSCAIQLDPRLLEAYHNRSGALNALGRFAEAEGDARMAIELRPDFPDAYFNLGNALMGQGRAEEAIAALRRAVELRPGYFDALMSLGVGNRKLLRFDEAIAVFRSAIGINPNSADAHTNLAVSLDNRGRGEEALRVFAVAIKLDPNNSRALSNYGYALAKVDRLDEALELCSAAVRQPNADADAYAHLAFVLKEKGNLEGAMDFCGRALRLQPGLAPAHNLMGNLLKEMGEIKGALEGYRRAAELMRDQPGFHSNLVYTMYFDGDCTPAQLFAEHKRWAECYCYPFRRFIRPWNNDRNPDRRLRIGYVSPDFRAHPVGRFMMPLLANHDRKNFEIFCYACVKAPDQITARARKYADVWRDINALTNHETAELVRSDQIDILVDLTMHMAENRLPLFARKPAPIQVTYLAYVGTTGLDTIDYRITDPWLDPPGSSDEFYSERSLRLARCYWCDEPPMKDIAVGPLPASEAGFVTFGCLNNFSKITPATLEAWCRILEAVPNSQLRLSTSLGAHRDRVRKKLADHSIDPGRVLFAEKLSLTKYLGTYNRIDIGLDPFPYVGGTTTCDALWMGVPVVTLRGKTAISRGGVTIMNNIGLPELIADSVEQYIRLAVDLANDRQRIADLRAGLRERMRCSPLQDAVRFARDMEAVYRRIWREFVLSRPPDNAGS
jgi:protein O-GlcNAc transferase